MHNTYLKKHSKNPLHRVISLCCLLNYTHCWAGGLFAQITTEHTHQHAIHTVKVFYTSTAWYLSPIPCTHFKVHLLTQIFLSSNKQEIALVTVFSSSLTAPTSALAPDDDLRVRLPPNTLVTLVLLMDTVMWCAFLDMQRYYYADCFHSILTRFFWTGTQNENRIYNHLCRQ